MPATASERLLNVWFVLGVCLWGMACVGLMFATGPIERWQCPADALLWGTTQFLEMVSIVILPVVAGGVWLVIVTLANFAPRLAESSFGTDPAPVAQIGGRITQVINWIAIAGAGAVLFVAANDVTKTYCVMAEGVTYRDGLFAPTETYAWSAVSSVVAACEHSVDSKGQGFNKVDYTLVMSNQRHIDLNMSSVAKVVNITSNALRAVPYHYDANGVSQRCSPDITGPLLAQAASAE